MSIGSSRWVSIEPQIIDRVVAGIHQHFAETDVTVQILKGSGPLEALEQGQKAVTFPLQTIHTDKMELSLITFRGDFNCVMIWQQS
ncbi:unnamed protein product [Sphagnum compactum]